MGFGIDIKGRGFDAGLAKESIRRAVKDGSEAMARHVRDRWLSGRRGERGLNALSGRLRRSTRALSPLVRGGLVTGGVVIDTPYAGVHVGPLGSSKTIRPRRSKYLAIPLPGTPPGRRPREIPGLFAFTSRKGNLLLATKTPGGDLSPMFVLKRSVVIRARVHPEEIVREMSPVILRGLRDAVTKGE